MSLKGRTYLERSKPVLVICNWWRRQTCNHHWHPADPMILWRCCHCGQDVDGWPKDRTRLCAIGGHDDHG